MDNVLAVDLGVALRLPFSADMQVTEDLHMVLDHLAYAVLGARLPAEDEEAERG